MLQSAATLGEKTTFDWLFRRKWEHLYTHDLVTLVPLLPQGTLPCAINAEGGYSGRAEVRGGWWMSKEKKEEEKYLCVCLQLFCQHNSILSEVWKG